MFRYSPLTSSMCLVLVLVYCVSSRIGIWKLMRCKKTTPITNCVLKSHYLQVLGCESSPPPRISIVQIFAHQDDHIPPPIYHIFGFVSLRMTFFKGISRVCTPGYRTFFFYPSPRLLDFRKMFRLFQPLPHSPTIRNSRAGYFALQQ